MSTAHLKIGQMTVELRRLNQRLADFHVAAEVASGKRCCTCSPKLLEDDLSDPLSRKLLSKCGYPPGNANACLAHLIARLRAEGEFPHEVGLFLGYPPADVDGFMHRKDSYKLCGLWKVYDDVEGAIRQFARCGRHEAYLRRYAQGIL